MFLNNTKHQGWTLFLLLHLLVNILTDRIGHQSREHWTQWSETANSQHLTLFLRLSFPWNKKKRKTLYNFVCLCDSKLPHFQSHHLSIGHILDWLWTLNIYYKVISETFLIQISIVNPVLIILISLVTCNSKITPKTSFWEYARKSNSSLASL